VVKAKIGDAEFEATGDETFVTEAFAKWIDTLRRIKRVPIEERLFGLQAQLTEQKRLLKNFDKEWPKRPQIIQ
jgi:hypothetical protein